MLRNRVNTVPSVRKIELSRENFCSGEPKLINFSTCRSSLEGCGRINQHFPNAKNGFKQVLAEPETWRNPDFMFESVHIYLVS